MKTFEERWTAWLDGKLTGKELADFEASLPDRSAAEVEKRSAIQLGVFLKEHLQTPAMINAEFFHHQLQQQITEDQRAENPPSIAVTRPVLWPIGRLAWAGFASLAIFFLCTIFVMRQTTPSDQSQYLTQILNARVDPVFSPDASISMFDSNEAKVTVLWIDGLQSLPSEYAAK